MKWPSKTIRAETTSGTCYATVMFENKKPISVILNIGKTGSEMRAASEAIGRLLTLNLKDDKLEEVIRELKDIKTEKSGLVQSLPDAIAKILEEVEND